VSELFGDSVRHSGSNDPGETITVSVTALDAGAVQVDVADRSVPACPAACGRK
jgi:anti-sigma regulatory factor (Ser/Thr protein kinase)